MRLGKRLEWLFAAIGWFTAKPKGTKPLLGLEDTHSFGGLKGKQKENPLWGRARTTHVPLAPLKIGPSCLGVTSKYPSFSLDMSP